MLSRSRPSNRLISSFSKYKRLDLHPKSFPSYRLFSNQVNPVGSLGELANSKTCFSCLDRAIIAVDGADSLTFIQSLVTNNVHELRGPRSTPSAPEQTWKSSLFVGFLNSQGRILYDGIIVAGNEPNSYWLDVDARSKYDIMSHIKKYKIRIKASINDLSNEYKVWTVFGKDVPRLESMSQENGKVFEDPRTSVLGLRLILPSNSRRTLIVVPAELTPFSIASVSASVTPVTPSIYNIYRTLLGVPEGPTEIPASHALPFEYNFDFLNGVHFSKGCYLGQELTARTYHTGVVRKRIFPVVPKEIFNPSETIDSLLPSYLVKNSTVQIPDPETTILADSAKTGKIITKHTNIGLAMIRLEHLNLKDIQKSTVKTEEKLQELQVLKPFWWERFNVDTLK